MSDDHINIFSSDDDGGYIADTKDLWLKAARAAGLAIPAPRYRPAIYQTVK